MDIKEIQSIIKVASRCNVKKITLADITIELYDQSNNTSLTRRPASSKKDLEAQTRAIEQAEQTTNFEDEQLRLIQLDIDDPVAYEQERMSQD